MMTVTCTRVEGSYHNGRACRVITAFADDRGAPPQPLPTDDRSLAAVKAKLAEMGLPLGGELQPGRVPPSARRYPTPPVQLLVEDAPAEKNITADDLEILELSTGSTWLSLYVFDLADDLRWLVGRRIGLVDAPTSLPSLKTG